MDWKEKIFKRKIRCGGNLTWGSHEFSLLGINFHVDLSKMPDLNLSTAITKIVELLVPWKKRALSPLGKVTVIKTFVLSKLNHLLMTLPSLSNKFIRDVNNILFNFLWDGKPDKIKRSQIYQPYVNGGIKMVNFECFVKSMKLTWIRRLIKGNSCQWLTLFEVSHCPVTRLADFGPYWGHLLAFKTNNTFWKEFFYVWKSFSGFINLKNNTSILSSPLW